MTATLAVDLDVMQPAEQQPRVDAFISLPQAGSSPGMGRKRCLIDQSNCVK